MPKKGTTPPKRPLAADKGKAKAKAADDDHGSTSAGTGSGTTPQSQTTQAGLSTTNALLQLSKRRRGLGVVTPNACTECRKKRAKCDGQKPCARCQATKDADCVYEVPVRQSKETLRTEIEALRLRQRSSDQVFGALIQPHLWEEVLARLRGGQSVDSISEWLRGVNVNVNVSGAATSSMFAQHADPTMMDHDLTMAAFDGSGAPIPTMTLTMDPGSIPMEMGGPASPWHFSSQSQGGSTRSGSHPDLMNWTAEMSVPQQSRVGSWTESMHTDHLADGTQRFRGLEQVLSPLNEPEFKQPSGTWTSITNDVNLVQHLLGLYFCWEYPTFASLSKEHFLRDFQDGRHRYCSPILVNALLALGCRFSTQPMTRANPNDPYSSGDHFFKESQRLFHAETDHHSLTTIQALGIMSIREASCGRDSESWYYAGQSIRLAVEMGLHRIHDEDDEDELAVQSATFWGAFALDHAWSLATGSLPQCSCFPHLPPKPAIIADIEASLWVPYTDDGEDRTTTFGVDAKGLPTNRSEGEPLQRSCEQPSNVRSVYKCFCELSELVHQSLYVLHSPGRPLTARDLLNIYTQYLNWYDRIPEVLRLGHNFTPAVLFAHMYYHFAILLLFRPLIKLRIIGSKVSPRDVCSQAADAIQGLLTSYAQLYTLRRTPSFVPYFVLTSSIMHLAIGANSVKSDGSETSEEKMKKAAKIDPRVSEALSKGIADLTEMAPCHHFAEQALNILRYLAKKWNIEVNVDGDKAPPEDPDNLVRPYSSSLNFFAPNVQENDFMCGWGASQEMVETLQAPSIKKAARTVENPLFWPFPMQGRPLLPTGEELEQAGFVML
ncbi:fungal-specific transcription factor domain-containing protein [Trichoderma chlorosporum]